MPARVQAQARSAPHLAAGFLRERLPFQRKAFEHLDGYVAENNSMFILQSCAAEQELPSEELQQGKATQRVRPRVMVCVRFNALRSRPLGVCVG